MRSKNLILLTLALIVQVTSYSQNVCTNVFSGQIHNESNQPVIGAAILILPLQQGMVTDIQGNFRFEDLCPGSYKIKVQYLGYEDVEFDIEVNGDVTRIIHLEEGATRLDEVVIHHHDVTLTEHARNFVQLDEKQLAESAGKSLGESLRQVSGVNSIQTGPGIFKPVIHGLHSQRILILNYGIRHEGQQWGAEHAPEIDPFVASNIVVIKDASAIKYGSDALGGVIVVNPAALPESAVLGGTFNSIFQSNGRSATVSGMLEGGLKGHNGWGWRAQGTGKRTGDFHTPHYSLTNTGIKELNFSASTGYHEEVKGFDIFFSRFQTEIGILKGTSIGNIDDLMAAMERSIPLYTTGFSYDIREPRQEVSHNLLKINGHIRTEYGEWRLQYGFQNNNRKEFDVRKGGRSGIPSIDLKLNTHTLDGEWETVHSEKRTISIGVNAMFQDNSNVPGTQRIPFIPDFDSYSAGIFGVTKLYMEKWTVDLGARYDFRHYDVKGYDFKNTFYSTRLNFQNISATAGASIRLRKRQSVDLSIASAWRPPHVSELFSGGTHQSAAAIEYGLLLNDTTNEVMSKDQAGFRTEQALKFVSTYRRQWDALGLEVSPYANYIFNYIHLRPEGITKNIRGVYPYFRYAQTDALFLGVDLTGTWQVGKYLRISPKASLLRASDVRNDDYLVFIPSNRFEMSLRYERPALSVFKNFYIESRTKYVARQNRAPVAISVREIREAAEQEAVFNPGGSNFDFMTPPQGYWLWDLSAGVSIKREGIQYDFRIASENTLDETYREYTNRFRYYAYDPGRNFIFSFKCIF